MPGFILICILALILQPTILLATVLARLSTEQLIQEAEVIVRGQIAHQESHRGDNGAIYTDVSFDVFEVIKGRLGEKYLKLRFFGGTLDGGKTTVDSSEIPSVGEQGVYFVKSTSEHYINPFVGWSQGHFRISADNRVLAGDGREVFGIDSVSGSGDFEIIHGTGDVIRTRSEMHTGDFLLRPLTPEEFLIRLKAMVTKAEGP